MSASRKLCAGLAAAGLALAGGCGTGDEPPAPQTPAAAQVGPEQVARRTLAELFGVPADEVTVISTTAREFRDASLDCPEPGMSYAQVLTPGWQVIVEADGRRFDVRVSGEAGRVCHRPRDRSAPGAPREAPRGPATSERARDDLAGRLGLVAAEIAVLDARPLGPGEGLPGCSPDCDGQDCGTAVTLAADGRVYRYRVDTGAARPCPPFGTS